MKTDFRFQVSGFRKSAHVFWISLTPDSLHLKPSSRGFTLLLAALIASIVLSLGAAIFSIAHKELALSSAGRESQLAFYAADTSAECALYWDVRYEYFGVTAPIGITPACDSQVLNAVVCASGDPCYSGDRASGNYTMTFTYAPNGYCSSVTVKKSRDADTGAISSVVHADGYSTKVSEASACDTAITTDQEALQRSVELNY